MGDSVTNRIATELERYLPSDLPGRQRLVELSARHLRLLSIVNRDLNLTRILSPREAAIKHVFDSVLPAPMLADAQLVLDVGSGAGFPGIPLAIVYPDKRFTVAESVGKKAAFLERVVRELGLSNANVYAGRAEEWLKSNTADAVVVRAVGSAQKLLRLLGPVRSRFRELILYKGPAGEQEMKTVRTVLHRLDLEGEVALRYRLPAGLGRRCVLRFVHTMTTDE